jgi:hypothetical protein
MQYCPRVKTLIASWDFKPNVLSIARMRCRQWDCEFCAIKNADMWRAHLLHTFCELMPQKRWIFVTLTVPSWAHELAPEISLKLLKRAWGGMYDRLRFKNGGKLSYVLVFETHKSGIFHAHALCDMGEVYDAYGVIIDFGQSYETRIDDEKAHPFGIWLKEKCTDEKLGWVCHATRIKEGVSGGDNARLAVGYLTKYLSKAVLEIVLPKRARRICTSRDIGSPRSKSKKKYSWVLKGVISVIAAKSYPHYLIAEDRILSASDFGDDGYYPSID